MRGRTFLRRSGVILQRWAAQSPLLHSQLEHRTMEPITPRASTRISIQWADQPPAEETDTLVLTFPRHYLDLRVYRSGHPQEGTIQWAQAGYVEQLSSDTGKTLQQIPTTRLTLASPETLHRLSSGR
jgi:hypothetical protein